MALVHCATVCTLTTDYSITKFDVEVGAPGGNRTPGLQVRSLSLYPSELRARSTFRRCSARTCRARGARTRSGYVKIAVCPISEKKKVGQ